MILKNAILLLFLLFSLGLQAQSDAISNYFSQYVDSEEYTSVYISGKMFDLMEAVISNVEESEDISEEQLTAIKEVVNEFSALRILSTDKPGIRLYNEAKATLVKGKEYELLIKVNDKHKSHFDFYVRNDPANDAVNEMLMLVGSEDNFTILSFEGIINLKNMQKLAAAFEED